MRDNERKRSAEFTVCCPGSLFVLLTFFCNASNNNHRWTIFGLTILAWIFSVVTIAHCSFIVTDGYGEGLFSYEYNGGCEGYESNDWMGTPMKTARAFGVLANLAIGFAMVLVVALQLFLGKFQKPLWIAVRILFSISFVCQSITFVFFAEEICDYSCNIGAASGIGIVNIFITIALITLSCMIAAPEKPAVDCKNCDCGVSDEEAGTESQVQEQPMAGVTTKIFVKEGPNGERTTTKEVTQENEYWTSAKTKLLMENRDRAEEKCEKIADKIRDLRPSNMDDTRHHKRTRLVKEYQRARCEFVQLQRQVSNALGMEFNPELEKDDASFLNESDEE